MSWTIDGARLCAMLGLVTSGCAAASGRPATPKPEPLARPATATTAARRPAPDQPGHPVAPTQSAAARQRTERSTPHATAAPDPYLTMDAPPRCPPEMALVAERVCVDRWEASLVEVLADGSERSWSPYGTPPVGTVTLRAVSKPGVVPQGYISGRRASEACRAAGKRLCTVTEWERACRGPADTAYPYGTTRVVGVCNDDGRAVHPVVEASRHAGLPLERMWYEGMDNPLINQLPHTLRATGERRGCTNAYGTYDMVGNLHEWIDDPEGTFRGGYYMDTWRNGDGCEYATVAHPFGYDDYSTGFRCCLDVDPVE